MKFGRTIEADEKKLWESIVAGDVQAFTTIVERHQASVSAIAYGIVGDFAASQDIAQETFFAAWKSREQLRDPTRAAAWLCGISRNLARKWQGKKYRAGRNEKTILTFEPSSNEDDPSLIAIAEEEQQIVWATLSKMPENYREVMLLYYRQGKSISNVATALEISEEAARQRLSRGRSMLRNRVSQLVEGVLKKTLPGRSFTAKVMSGLVGLGIASKASGAAATGSALGAGIAAGKAASGAATASATAGGAAGAGAKTVAATGLAGALPGFLGFALGHVLGVILPSELAPSESERQFRRKRGSHSFIRGLCFAVAIFALVPLTAYFKFPVHYYLAGLALLLAIFIPFELWYLRKSNQMIAKFRKESWGDTDPNQSVFKNKIESHGLLKYLTGWRGRRYRSPISFLGLPLIDIQVNDPEFDTGFRENYTAKGWIAIGDRAYGVLVALGTLAVGGFAFGGRAIGLIALGPLAIGVFSLGGAAAGLIAIGGAAAGWDSAGGVAAGWNSAAGSRVYAHHVASGDHAVAMDFAVGRIARANETNTESARAVADAESLQWMLDYFIANQVFCSVAFIAIVLGLTAIFLGLAIKHRSWVPQE